MVLLPSWCCNWVFQRLFQHLSSQLLQDGGEPGQSTELCDYKPMHLEKTKRLTGKHPDARRLKAKGEKGGRGWDSWMAITNSRDMNLSKPLEIVEDREAWCASVNGVANSRTRLSDWKQQQAYAFTSLAEKWAPWSEAVCVEYHDHGWGIL